jgi:hypothetical protein
MRYCYQCGHLTSGTPLFCNQCGRSFDVKLCPRLHANPRSAEVCSQCGSRELSLPQRKVSFLWHVLAFVLRVVVGALLVWLSLVVGVDLVRELLKQPVVQIGMIALSLLLVALWFLWSLIPHWLQKAIRRMLSRKERHHEE